MDSTQTVDRILHATSEIMSSEGVRSLTLEAVARQAGVSKGGLLYHFPTKHALLRALLLREFGRYEAEVERRAATLAPGPGRWLRAYVEEAFDDPAPALGPELLSALIGVFAEEPELLGTVAGQYGRWQQVMGEDADDSAQAAVVMLALDGLWLADVMGMGFPEQADREALRQVLSDLASGRLRRTTSGQGAAESGFADE